jgi:peptidyl-prolyl cis-trans isomerase SurA
MNEFRDGNIFFEIMQQEVWNKAQNDTAALRMIYEQNRQKYNWNKSAVAVIFYCSDEATAKFIYDEVKKDPASWRKVSEEYAEKVVADSSRFEWEQLPSNIASAPKPGMVSAPVVNPNDNSASFAYVVNVSTTPIPRSFNEAKGLVINDYQEILEKTWTDTLRKKYPVKVNEKVLEEISR